MKALGIRSSSVLSFIVSVTAVGQLMAAMDAPSPAKDASTAPALIGEAEKNAIPAPTSSDANRTPSADTTTPSAQRPRLVVAVLPFENATGDPAGDDWRQALPSLIRMGLDLAEFTSAPAGKKIRSALQRSGWTATNTIETALAREVAREVNANVVVWGRFTRATNGWTLDAKILRAVEESPPVELQVASPRWTELAESAPLRLAELLERRIADGDRRFWSTVMLTDSDKAAGCLAKAIGLEIQATVFSVQGSRWDF